MLNDPDVLLQDIARRTIYLFYSPVDDFLTLVMLPLKQAWDLLLKLHEYIADVCYKLVILQNIAWLFKWNNNETTNGFN